VFRRFIYMVNIYMSSNEEDKSSASSSAFDVSGANQGAASAASGATGIAMVIALPMLGALWFMIGSWQLSLFIDQIKCHKGETGCLLPTDTNNFPYKNPTTKVTPSAPEAIEAAGTALGDIMELQLGKILGVTPKKQKGGRRRGRKRHKQRGGGGPRVNNLLTSIDINGFRPFDIFNGPAQMPYSLAYDKSPWYEPSFLNFGKWFGHMQITAWSTARMVLSGYLSAIGALITSKNETMNYWSRLLVTLAMPLLLAIPLFVAPLVSFVSCLWGMFKGGYNYLFAILFFIFPCLTVITMALQHLSLIGYFLIGGLLGSGHQQLTKNFSSSSGGGYLGILQSAMLMLLLGMLVLVIMGAVAKKEDAKTKGA